MSGLTATPDYRAFLTDLKDRVRRAQLSASLSVNQELIQHYWSTGRDILAQVWPDEEKVKQRVSRLPLGHIIRLMRCTPWINSKPS